jgi:hypothetical protein
MASITEPETTTSERTTNDDAKTKIDLVTEGLTYQYADRLYKIRNDNSLSIIDFLISRKTEINLSSHHAKNNIMVLSLLSQYHQNEKSYKEMTRKDILSYLDRLRKPESVDPLHKWIGTYNLYKDLITTFFKWLYYPNLKPSERQRPAAVENIPKLKRKEQSIYKPSDLWTRRRFTIFKILP